MSDLLIKNGTVLDPSEGLDGKSDIRIIDGKIAEIAPGLDGGKEVIDAEGLTVVPGLIDVHVHFREPGDEGEETIASGCASAVAGGFTSVACMPNTDPAMDSESSVSFVYLQAEKAGLCNVYPVGAITKGRDGKELAEMGSMVRGGAVAFSDDGTSVTTAGVLRHAMEYSLMLDKPIMEHCEEPTLAGKGVMHEGEISTSLGLPGIPAEAEEMIVSRGIMLAKLTGARLHIQHVSTAGSIKLVKLAKEEGLKVTAEVCPHHLLLTDECVKGYNSYFKMNPPLRPESDRLACVEGLKDGTIDMVASDHAPHSEEEKAIEFSYAAFGAIGLESTVGVLLSGLVDKGVMTLKELLPRLTTAPAELLGIDRGSLKVGSSADLALLDLEQKWTIDPELFASKSRNCPFAGMECKGRNVITVVDGKVVYKL
ncbi:MAG: dihydroorotase [Planctomycetota bacterium]|jgi:dihydroorotase